MWNAKRSFSRTLISLYVQALLRPALSAGFNANLIYSGVAIATLYRIPSLYVQALLRHNVDPQPASMLTSCIPGWPLQHCIVYRRMSCFLELLKAGAKPTLQFSGAERAGWDQNVIQRLSITRTALKYAG